MGLQVSGVVRTYRGASRMPSGKPKKKKKGKKG
jgi:hypothetical protein